MPSLSDAIADLIRRAEDDIVSFEGRMREVEPSYRLGDQVELAGELYTVDRYQREGMPGYWLRRQRRDDLFLPIDMERSLRAVVH
jgi:hypothetical protein